MKLIIKYIVLTMLCTLAHRAYSMTPEELLFKYAQEDKAQELEQLLKDHPNLDVNTKNKYLFNTTPLHYAAENNCLKVAAILLAKGANPNIQDTNLKETPLHCAVSNHHQEMVSFLMNNPSTDASLKDFLEATALECAQDRTKSNRFNQPLAKAYQEISNIIQTKEQEKEPIRAEKLFFAIKKAIQTNNLQELENLLKNNRLLALALRVEHNGDTILHLAVKNKKFDVFALILQQAPELVHVKNKEGKIPLALAAAQHFFSTHAPKLQLLINKLQAQAKAEQDKKEQEEPAAKKRKIEVSYARRDGGGCPIGEY